MTLDHEISGYDFVRAMLLAGYRVVRTTLGCAVLARGETELIVPQPGDLPQQTVMALLEKANMLPLSLVMLLNRLKSRDTWPDMGVREVAGSGNG